MDVTVRNSFTSDTPHIRDSLCDTNSVLVLLCGSNVWFWGLRVHHLRHDVAKVILGLRNKEFVDNWPAFLCSIRNFRSRFIWTWNPIICTWNPIHQESWWTWFADPKLLRKCVVTHARAWESLTRESLVSSRCVVAYVRDSVLCVVAYARKSLLWESLAIR